MADLYRFAAFISYSSHDAPFARRLQRTLEAYRIPKSLGTFDLAGKRNRVAPIFRDHDELASGHLGENIQAALRASSALIVVCSPSAARSEWVEREVRYFRSLGRDARLFAIIAGGEPHARADRAQFECLPLALRNLPDGDEVLASDPRAARSGFRTACLKLVAGLIGVTLGRLIDRDRKARRRQFAVWATALGLTLAAAGAAYAVLDALRTADAWRAYAAQRATTGEPYEAAPFAVAAVADATSLRRLVDGAAASQPLRDTGFGQRALLLIRDRFAVDKQVFFRNGTRLLTVSNENAGVLWDVDHGVRLIDLGPIMAWEISDDESRLVVRSTTDQALVFDAHTGTRIAALGAPGSARAIYVSKKFGFVVTRSVERQCAVWDMKDGRLLAALTPPRSCNAVGMPDDAPLVNVRRPDRTGFIASGSGATVGELPSCEFCEISRNGRVAYGFRDNIGAFVDAGTARVLSRIRLDAGLAMIEFDDTGDRVVILDQAGLLTLWNTRTGAQIAEIGPSDSGKWNASRSRKHVMLTPDDDSGEVWRMADGARLLSVPAGSAVNMVSSKDGSVIATVGKSGALYDGASGALIAHLPEEGRRIQSITLSDDSRRAVVASDGAPGYLYDIPGRKKVVEFREQGEDVNDQGEFSDDSQRYATSGAGGQSNLWDAVTGAYLARLGGEETAFGLRLSRDGTRALTVTSYSEAAVWDLSDPPGDLAATTLRARACALNYEAIGAFSVADRASHGMLGLPWRACDWRGLASSEGWAQLFRRWAYRLHLVRDYDCAETTAGGRQTAESQATCRSR